MYIDKYVKPKDGDKILDIGCGTADILEYLPNVEYLGFDMNNRYIQFALQKYGNRGKFFCKKVNLDVLDNKVLFDIIMALLPI